MAKPFIKINGKEFPCPSCGLDFEGQCLVYSVRNAARVYEVVEAVMSETQSQQGTVTVNSTAYLDGQGVFAR